MKVTGENWDDATKVAALARAAGMAVLLAAAGELHAAQTEFDSAIFMALSATDNVQYLGGTGNAAYLSGVQVKQPDRSILVGVDLALDTNWQRTNLKLGYRPFYTKNQTTTALNRAEHRFESRITSTLGRSVVFAGFADFERTQLQGRPGPDPSAPKDIVLAPRTDRAAIRGGFQIEQRVNERWAWNVAASAFEENYTPIEEFATLLPVFVVEDRTGYGVGLGATRGTGNGNSWGLAYQFNRVDLAQSGVDDVHLLDTSVSRVLARGSTITVTAGGYYRRESGGTTPGSSPAGEDNGLSFRLAWLKNFRRIALTVDGGITPTSGGALRGTSVDTTGGVAVGSINDRSHWTWRTIARAGHRDPADPALPIVDTLALGAGVDWHSLRLVGWRLMADHVIQKSSGEGYLDGTFTTVTTGLVIYLTGRYTRDR